MKSSPAHSLRFARRLLLLLFVAGTSSHLVAAPPLQSQLPASFPQTGGRALNNKEASHSASKPPEDSNRGWTFPHVALANNVAPNEWLTPWTVNRRFQQAVDAGVTFIYICPKWNELEPSPGAYNFKDLDFQVQQAVRANLPIILQIRVIDTNQSTVPQDLRGKAFDDTEVRGRLLRLIDATAPHLKGRTRYLLLGNEIDPYFSAHENEIQGYANLFREARARAKQQFNGVPASATITFDGMETVGKTLKPIFQSSDFFSVTYYPLRPDFIVREPTTVVPDLQRIMRAAGNQKVFLQEVGYPTSPLNNSSQEKQADLFGRLLTAVASARDRFIGLNFLFMCDLSAKVTEDLAQGFNVAHVDRFKAYLQTLGMFDGQGLPKRSWSVFSQQARHVGQP